jgi:hypothetical protein
MNEPMDGPATTRSGMKPCEMQFVYWDCPLFRL